MSAFFKLPTGYFTSWIDDTGPYILAPASVYLLLPTQGSTIVALNGLGFSKRADGFWIRDSDGSGPYVRIAADSFALFGGDSSGAPNFASITGDPATNSALVTYVAENTGNGVPTLVSYATAIPLNVVDPGVYMAQHAVVADTVFTVATGSVDFGACLVTVLMDGTHTVDVTAFNVISGATLMSSGILTGVDGHAYALQFVRLSGTLQVGVSDLGLASALPTLVSATVSNSTPSQINFVWSKPMNSAVSAASAFAVSAGHASGTHVYDDATHSHLTVATPFVNGEAARTLAYTQPGTNNMQDLLGNLVANFSGVAITNGVLAPARVFNFVQADSLTTLNPPNDGGSGWVVTGAACGISSNQGYCTNGGIDTSAVLETGNIDGEQFFNLDFVNAGFEDFDGPLFRYIDANNNLWTNTSNANGNVSLHATVAGVEVFGVTSPNNVFTPGSVAKLQCKYVGDSIQVWVNDVHIPECDYTIVDTALRTGTKIGYRWPAAGNHTRLVSIG